jgi:hypothetical protein
VLEPPERGTTVKELMKLEWDYPVYVKPQIGNYSRSGREALPREEALAYIAGDDPRPLVIVRECGWCKGSDDALLSERLDNEKTMLMSKWFHMVKLPNDVLSDDHPFRNLFEGGDPPHLFVTKRDGSLNVALSGQQSQTELWAALRDVLDATYKVDAEQAVRRMYKLLDKFDELDQTEARLSANLSDEIESKGARSGKIKKLKQDLEQVEDERKLTQAELDELRDLAGNRKDSKG